jgi:hypothetical protein
MSLATRETLKSVFLLVRRRNNTKREKKETSVTTGCRPSRLAAWNITHSPEKIREFEILAATESSRTGTIVVVVVVVLYLFI